MRKILTVAIAGLLAVSAVSPAVASDFVTDIPEPPPMDERIPAEFAGVEHARQVIRVSRDDSNPERAEQTREQIAATCDDANENGFIATAGRFTDDASRERLLRAPGLGASPNLPKSANGTIARLFPIPMSSNDRLLGYRADRVTKQQQYLHAIYTEQYKNVERQMFSTAYVRWLCTRSG